MSKIGFDEISLRDSCEETKQWIEKVGNKVKCLREENNLTQMDVAFYIFADKSMVSAIERKVVKNITLKTLIRFSKLFKINLTELLG